MHSISRSAEFAELRNSGVRIRGGAISLTCIASNDGDTRVGISIPRKVGNAVVRNRIRRQVKACLREISANVQPGRYAFLIYPEVLRLNYHQILEIARSLMAQADVRLAAVSSALEETNKDSR